MTTRTLHILIAAVAAALAIAASASAAMTAPVIHAPLGEQNLRVIDYEIKFVTMFDFDPNMAAKLDVRVSRGRGVDDQGRLLTGMGSETRVLQQSNQGYYRADVKVATGQSQPGEFLYWQVVYDDDDANGSRIIKVSPVQQIRLQPGPPPTPQPDPSDGTGSGGSGSGGNGSGSGGGGGAYVPPDPVAPDLSHLTPIAPEYVAPATTSGQNSGGQAVVRKRSARLVVSTPRKRPRGGRVQVYGSSASATGTVTIVLSTTKGKVKARTALRGGRFNKHVRVKKNARVRSIAVTFAGNSKVLPGRATKRAR